MRSPSMHLPALDLCRGLAAITVLLFHIDFLFYGQQVLFQRGYLCVDFFFLLSGYVVASSYDWKLSQGLGVLAFTGIRIARLWPLVVLTSVIGFVAQVPRLQRDLGSLDPIALIASLGSNLLMLPAFTSPIKFLFPFNGAAWSIFFELAINIFYAAAFKQLTERILAFLCAGGAVALALIAVAENTLDVGWSNSNFTLGFARVSYSFFAGVLFFRFRTNLDMPALNYRYPLIAVLTTAAFLLSTTISVSGMNNGLFDLFIVLVFFPCVLAVAINARLSERTEALAWFLGGTSYAVYLLQTPLVIIYSALPQIIFGKKIMNYAPLAGFAFVPLLLGAAYFTWIYFERPVQARLRRAFADGLTKKL